MKEIEAWGVTYERYALGRALEYLKRKYLIQNVAEIPAHGAKAMPSVYSIGFALAGSHVTLVSGVDSYYCYWNQLGLDDKVRFVRVNSLYDTNIADDSFDFVWNFAYLSLDTNKDRLIREMKRISRKYVAFFSVNYGNIGFHIHRAVHRIMRVPWTHGDITYNNYRNVALCMRMHGLRIVERGFVDCPIWPDSVGFRDMRLHRENISGEDELWESPYISYLISGDFPLWIKLVYTWEKIPMPAFIRTVYSHINYVIAEKAEDWEEF